MTVSQVVTLDSHYDGCWAGMPKTRAIRALLKACPFALVVSVRLHIIIDQH